MTELEAVQHIARIVTGYPVPSLETGQQSVGGEMTSALDYARKTILGNRWGFNTRYRVTVNPDVNGRLPVPSGTLWAEIDPGGDNGHLFGRLIVQGGFFFDVEHNTDIFTYSVQVRYGMDTQFAQIPDPIQRYITASGAMNFARQRQISDRTVLTLIQDELATTNAAAMAYDTSSNAINIFRTEQGNRIIGRRW